MKKLLVVLGLLALPLFAAAAEVPDVLLTAAGDLFTISSEAPAETAVTEATMHLVLTERRGGETIREIVPATTERGVHSNPVLGYDPESRTLFVFWIQHLDPQSLYNQLLFVTRDSNGNWSETTEFGSPYNYRENLRVAVTRKVTGEDGNANSAGLTIHATWWEFDTLTALESAQYRMLSIENGRVVDVAELNLSTFIDDDLSGPEEIDLTVLKHPLLTTSSRQDSVLLTFGAFENRSFSQVRITPKVKSDGRLRVPIGKREGRFSAPNMNITAGSTLEGIFSENDKLAFYTTVDGAVQYVILEDGQWSETRSIAVDEQLSGNVAVGALRKMVAEQ